MDLQATGVLRAQTVPRAFLVNQGRRGTGVSEGPGAIRGIPGFRALDTGSVITGMALALVSATGEAILGTNP